MAKDEQRERIKTNNDEIKSLEEIVSAEDRVIKKYKERDIAAEKSGASFKRLVESLKDVPDEVDKLIGSYKKSSPIIEKLDTKFKGIGKISKIFKKAEAIEDIVNIIGDPIKAYQKDIPIKTPIEGVQLSSVEEWMLFYNDIIEAREVDLTKLSGNALIKKQEENKTFDELMQVELERHKALVKLREEYDKEYRTLNIGKYFFEFLPFANIKDPIKELKANEKKVNANFDKQRDSISNKSISSTNTTFDANKAKIHNRIKAEQAINNQLKDLESDKLDFFFDIQEKLTAAMNEGYEKRQRIIDLNYEKEKQAAENYKTQRFEDQEKLAKNIFVKANGSDIGFDIKRFNQSLLPSNLQTSEIISQYEQYITAADLLHKKRTEDLAKEEDLKDQAKIEKEKNFWDEYNKLYGDSLTKKEALINEYNRRITKAEYNGEKAILKKQLERDLTKLSKETLEASIGYQRFFTSIYSITNKEAKNIGDSIKKNLKEQMDKGVISAKEYEESIKNINNQLEKSSKGLDFFKIGQQNGIGGIFDSINTKANSDYNSANIDFNKAETSFKESNTAYWESVLKYRDAFTNNKANIGTAQNDMISAFGKQLDAQGAMKTAQGAMQGAQGLQKFAGAAQGVIGMVDMIVTAIDQGIRATQRIVDAFANLAEQRGIDTTKGTWGEIREGMSVLSQVNVKAKESWDLLKGGDAVGSFASVVEMGAIFLKSANKEHREALKLLERQKAQMEHIYSLALLRSSLEYKMNDTVFGSNNWGKARNAADVYKKSVNQLNGSLKKLENVEVVTGSKKSGWGPFRKRKDVWSDLLSTYDDLIQKDGKLNVARAESILSTQKLKEEGKTALQYAIENAKLVEEAYAGMKDYLTDIFGELGNSITDAFIKSFQTGADAVNLIKESAADMLEQLTKDMIYSVTLEPLMKKYSEQMMAVAENTYLTDEDRFNRYLNIINSTVDQAISKQDEANRLLEASKNKAKEKDLEIFEPEIPETTSGKGLAAITQESANQLNGSFDNMLRYTSAIFDNTEQSLFVQRTMESQLNRIADNTEYCRYLENVKNSLEEIQTKGVRMRA